MLVLVQDGDVGRSWTHLLHRHTKSPPTYRAIPPKEKLRADWTVSTQQKIEWKERQKHRNEDTLPDATNHSGEG